MKNKSLLAILLAFSMCIASVSPALAAENTGVETEADPVLMEEVQDTEPSEVMGEETDLAGEPQEQDAQNAAAMEEVSAEADEDAESAESDEEAALEEPDTDAVSAESDKEAASEENPDSEDELAPEEPEFTGEIVVDGGEQSVIPGDSGKGDPNELFAEYVNEAFSTAGASKRKKSRRNTGSRLTGVEGAIYAGIASQLPAIASGERASTVFEFSAEEIGMQTTWTAQDLGVNAILEQTSSGGYVVTQEAKDAFAEKTKYNLDIIIDALLFDYPYELYWYEKTQRTQGSGFGYTASSRRITITTKLHIDFPVADEFSAGEFTVDTSIGQSVQTAVANANAIVEEYSGASDEDKLYGFKNEICDLTSYNYDAINYNYEYGNPWQMIWVFDGDDTTKVVCEGYSKAFKYLCDRSTFSGSTSCLLVTGKINGGPHMWNIVRRADCYNYLVDVTNCDGSSSGAPDKLFLKRTDDLTISDGIETGYIFHLPTRNIVYEYEDDTLDYYTQGELTLGAPQHTINKIEAAAPTCTEDGNIDYWICSKCGVVFSDAEGTVEITLADTVIEAEGHALSKTDASAATCTEDGNIDYWTCSKCEEVFRDEEGTDEITLADTVIEAEGHELSKTDASAATCTEDGNIDYWICSKCGVVFSDAEGTEEITLADTVIEAEGHELSKTDASAATCTEDGNIDYWTCSKCGVVFSDAEGTVETALPETVIPAIGHIWSEWVVIKEATTREEGTERRTCLNDESHTEERAIPKLVWKKDSKGWWLLRGDGSYPAGAFETVDGEIYYFDANGYMVTGWRLVDSKWYYFAASGVMQTGWKQIGGVWYYFDEDGVMQTGLQELDGVWYYFKASGAMASGWQKISGVWYYFNAGGAMQTGWQRLDGVWYYLDDSGVMLTGWQELGGVWYYFNASGAMASGWQKISGVWYYFNAGGAMQTGWQRLDGVWYYFNAGGAMQTGWQRLGGVWYYFSASGAMQTGWQELDGAWYYFYESGDMAADTWIGDYYMGPDGKWVP